MLRDTGRAYFLLELLEMKIKIVECMRKTSESEKQQSTEMAALLKTLCDEYEVPVYMQDCTYLYRQRWMFYVGDVLRIRRRMYGLTQKDLCEGICSVRTLRRAEKREVNMQQGVLGLLLRKLGLSKEFQRTRLVTNDREVIKLRERMAAYRNNHEIAKAREILRQIKERVSIEIPENQQYFMELEASLDWIEGKITKEEFAAREEAALRCTLKRKDLHYMDEIYLTEMELSCIRNRIQVLGDTEKREYIDFLLNFFERYEGKDSLGDCIPIYEHVMFCIVSELGNLGEHQKAITFSKKALKEDLKCNRVWGVDGYIYEILWNEIEQQRNIGQIMRKEKMTESLQQCILLSHFCKQILDEKFYYDKLYQE